MPQFATPFSIKKSDKKLTNEELIRAIRFSIASEYEAIQIYEEIIESTDNEEVIKLLKEIANDEKVHTGNFLYLMKILAPDEKNSYKDGAAEAEEILKKD